jgi:hypothetical protein
MLLAGKLIQAKGFERSAELSGKDGDFGNRVLVETRFGSAAQKGDNANQFSGNRNRRSQGGVGAGCSQPGISSNVKLIDETGLTLQHCVKRNGAVAGATADATKRVSPVASGFRANEFTIGGKTPVVGAFGVKVGASEGAKRAEELAGIMVLKSGAGKLQEKLLESLVRMRRNRGPRISGVGCQCSPALR